MDVVIRGGDQLVDLSRALRRVGDKELRRELFRGIQRSTKPLRTDLRTAALTDLPRAGGLNRVVAASRFSTRTRTGLRTAGVRVEVKGRGVRDIRAIDRGRLRHPVHADGPRATWEWVTQAIRPGVLSEPFDRGAPAVRRELLDVMERVVREIARRAT